MKNIINELLYITPTSPIISRYFNYKHFTYPWHFHSEFEIMYIEKGYGEFIIGDSIMNYSDETLFLIGSELPHWIQNPPEYKKDNELRVNGAIIQFEKDFMQYAFSNYKQFIKIHELLGYANRGIRFKIKEYPIIKQYLNKILQEDGVEKIVYFLRLLDSLTSVEDKELAATPNYNFTLTGYKDKKIEKVIKYLNSKYTQNINLNEIAEFAAMNTTAFCRFFKEKTGKTCMEYIHEMRIGYACKLLYLGSMNISQISLECGFDTISNFNRYFKKIVGCSPTTFKNKFKKKSIL